MGFMMLKSFMAGALNDDWAGFFINESKDSFDEFKLNKERFSHFEFHIEL